MTHLGRTLLAAGRPADALALFEETFKLRRARLGADHPHTLITMNDIAAANLDLRAGPRPWPWRECLGLRERKEPPDWERFHTMSQLGAALAGQRKYADAEPFLLQGYRGLKGARR